MTIIIGNAGARARTFVIGVSKPVLLLFPTAC